MSIQSLTVFGCDVQMSVVVFDFGSSHIRAGIAGETAPLVSIPSICGVPKDKLQANTVIGKEALTKQQDYTISLTIERSNVVNFDNLEV